MVFCSNCGTESDAKANFCNECGTKLLTKIKNETENKKLIKKLNNSIPPKSSYVNQSEINALKSQIMLIKCPSCRTKNNPNRAVCKKCGKDLKETIAFFRGHSPIMNFDIEITHDYLIIYPRGNILEKRKGKVKKYRRSQIMYPSIHRGNELKFDYGKKLKKYTILPEYSNKLKALLKGEEFNTQLPTKIKLDIKPVEKIKNAKELLDMGAITEEEFNGIKEKYLKHI